MPRGEGIYGVAMHPAIVLCALLAILLIFIAAGVELGWFRPGGGTPPHHWPPPPPHGVPGSPGSPGGAGCVPGACPSGQICADYQCVPAPPRGACAFSGGPPGPPGRQQLDAKSLPLLSYFQALYPQGDTPAGLQSLTGAQLLQLYDSLKWYYLPLVSPIDPSRRGSGSDSRGVYPIKGPWVDAETQWFLADGADCGEPTKPGGFTCSVFGGACTTSEWGGAAGGGRPYQYISFIKPYGRRGGSPSYAYIECVAFVCEALGRKLLSAGDGWGAQECSPTAPSWQAFLDNPQAGQVVNWNKKGGFAGGPWAEMYGDSGDDNDYLSEREGWMASPGGAHAAAFGGRTALDPLAYTGGGRRTGNDPPWHVPPGLRRGGTAADTHGLLGVDIAAAGPPGPGGPLSAAGPFGTPEGWRAQAVPTGLGGDGAAPLWLGAQGRLPGREGYRGHPSYHRPSYPPSHHPAGGGKNCPNQQDCGSTPGPQANDPGCVIGRGSMKDVCCWDWKTNAISPTACVWPTTCPAAAGAGGKVAGNYCTTPCGYLGCDVTAPYAQGGCAWLIKGVPWEQWLQKQKPARGYTAARAIIDALRTSRPSIGTGTLPPGGSPGSFTGRHRLEGLAARPHPHLTAGVLGVGGPGDASGAFRPDTPTKTTMFYWIPGYGKFLNMGKTGVFLMYEHMLLTAPRTGKMYDWGSKKFLTVPIRWSYPQVLTTATQGNQGLVTQLMGLMSGRYRDPRRYLEGFVTTLRDGPGTPYKAGTYTPVQGGVEIPNKQPFDVMNPLLNPLDDDNLRAIAKLTVTKYYDPGGHKTPNPQSGQSIAFLPYQAVMLQQGMLIGGATANGSATNLRYVTMSGKRTGQHGAGVWPFGCHFSGSDIGHCIYQLTGMCNWDSTQFTQMPTGAGGGKYCNYPEYDYEIVYVQDKTIMCKGFFMMLDPIQDWKNYTSYGFVQGSAAATKAAREAADAKCLNAQPFDTKKMRLTERNVPDAWKPPMPNAAQYLQPAEFIPDVSKCTYTDRVYDPWAAKHGGGINPTWYTG